MRRLIYANAAAIDLSEHHGDPAVREANAEIASLMTPLSKAWSTDVGFEMASMGVQIHGGMGFIEETGAAQHMRDARIAMIYEGTNGIQAIDLIGRKLGVRGGAAIGEYLDRIGATVQSMAAFDVLALSAAALADALDAARSTTKWMLTTTDNDDRLAGATPYLRIVALVTAADLMAQSAIARLGANDTNSADAQLQTTRFFCEQLLPAAGGLSASVMAGASALRSGSQHLDVA